MNQFIRWLFYQIRSLFANTVEMLSLINPFRSNNAYDDPSFSAAGGKRSWIGYFTNLPGQIAYDLYSLIFFWRSRSQSKERAKPKYWLIGLVLFVITTAGGVFAYLHYQSDKTSRVRTEFLSALERGDDKTAEQLGDSLFKDASRHDPIVLFKYSELLNRLQRNDDSDKVLQIIAPENRPGLPIAHVVRAGKLIASMNSSRPSDSLNSLRWHLTCAGDENPGTVEWFWYLYYRAVRQIPTGIAHLEKASRFNRDLLLPLCDAYREIGNTTSLSRTLEEAYATYQDQIKQDPSNENAVVKFVSVAVQMQKFEEAKKLLESRISSNGQSKLKPILAQVLVRLFDSEFSSTPRNIRIELLKASLEYDPKCETALNRLSQIHGSRFDSAQKEEARSILEKLISDGHGDAHTHFALGTFQLVEGQHDLAMEHLNKSIDLDKFSASACNNLAWLLADKEIDLDRALDLAQQAVKSNPDFLPYRDTLATVYMKRGDFDNAVLEFQRVLEGPGDHRSVHQNLAIIYTKLGNERFAELHRKQLSKPMKTPSSKPL